MKQDIGNRFYEEDIQIRQRWYAWASSRDFSNIPNIGTMLQFLDERAQGLIGLYRTMDDPGSWRVVVRENVWGEVPGAPHELVDLLWQITKEELGE